jgi:hypothetical protein
MTDPLEGDGSSGKIYPDPQTWIGAEPGRRADVIHWMTDPAAVRSASAKAAHSTLSPKSRRKSTGFIASPKFGSSFHQYTLRSLTAETSAR